MKEILFVPHLHFDPVWRRCFKRSANYRGTIVRSYAEVEEHCINGWLELASGGYPFSDGQAAVWREYLRRNPGRLSTLQQEAKKGTLDVVLAGEVVPDTVLSSAEGLVRNFLVAQPLYQQLVPADHPGLRLAWLEDAFGNGANYPQVLAGVGATAAGATTYRVCPDPVWIGIDGTRLPCIDHYPAVRRGGFEKNPPCPECNGKGCRKCSGTGLRFFPGFDLQEMRKALDEAASKPGDWAAVFVLTEEIIPDPRLKPLLDDFNKQYRGRAHVRFANPSDIYRRYLPELQRSVSRLEKSDPTPELCPAMPGCMVTRIRCKQRTREVAYQLIAAEAELANAAWLQKRLRIPPSDLATAWQQVCFNQFHDAITGTHIDAAYDELMEMLDGAEMIARSHLPKAKRKSQKTRCTFQKKGPHPQRVCWGKFEISFDQRGILSVLTEGQDLFGTVPGFTRLCRPYRIAELVLESDFGDAWGQRIAPFPEVAQDASRIALGDYQTQVEVDVATQAIRWKGRYTGGDPKVKKLGWTVTMRVSEDRQRLDFCTEVDWDTSSRRLRVLVPVASSETKALYEIPFGFIERAFEKEKLDYGQWRSHSMEFPTLHWAWKSVEKKGGVALFNKGLPCVRWMPNRFDLSLLRSPEWAFCAVEPGNYEFWDIDGQRDTGHHRFEYSLWPSNRTVFPHELTQTGYDYNRPCDWALPFSIRGNAVVTAWKLAENGEGWILRLQESAGKGGVITLEFSEPVQLTATNLLEAPLKPATAEKIRHRLTLRRHEIYTAFLKPKRATSKRA